MGFLGVILVVIIGYYMLKWLARWLTPRFVQYAARKMEERFQGQFSYNDTNTQPPEGEVSIDKRPKRRRDSAKTVGEYIDFEELE